MGVRFDAIGIVVSDMEASIAFYERLGLEFPAGASGEQHLEASLPGGARLMLDTEDLMRRLDESWAPPSGGHRIALAFLCDDPAEVDSLHSTLTAAGHESVAGPYDAPWGQRYATVHDPDGNPVDLFAPLE